MSPYSPLLTLVILSMAVLALTPGAWWSFLDSDTPPHGNRYVSLDGLRGFLAMAVVIHHTAVTYGYLGTGQWIVPPSDFYTLLGQAGVAVFFMITAFLFWGRLLDTGARMEWFSLYCNRFFRITPLYLVAILFMFAAVACRTGFALHVPVRDLLSQLFRWLLPALVKADYAPAINGLEKPWIAIAGVTWTLYYEWMFYFSLPLLMIGARFRKAWAFLPALFALYFFAPGMFSGVEKFFMALFAFGMIAATLVRRYPRILGDRAWKSVLVIALLALLLTTSHTAYRWGPILLLAAVFLLVCSGASLFGLLHQRGAVRMGTISYGIYILQGPVLTMVFAPDVLGGLALQSQPVYWLAAVGNALALIAVAAIAHRYIEQPGIDLGKRLAARAQRVIAGPTLTSPAAAAPQDRQRRQAWERRR